MFLSRDSQDYYADITNTVGINQTPIQSKPEIIINAASYTSVDQAESRSERAFAVNTEAVGLIAEIAAQLNAF